MNKLTSKEKLIVDEYRKDIKVLQLKQDELYNNMISKLKMINESQEDWLFDYVYNCEDNLDNQYTKQVINKLF
jgi:UDP-glucose 6-dehydrogenase